MTAQTGCINQIVHAENAQLWAQAGEAAAQIGCAVRANATTISKFEGRISYVVLQAVASNYYRSSRECIAYTEAPYSRYWKPTARSERDAIVKLIAIIAAQGVA